MTTRVKFEDTGEIVEMEVPDPFPITYAEPQPGDVLYDVIRAPEAPDYAILLRRRNIQ